MGSDAAMFHYFHQGHLDVSDLLDEPDDEAAAHNHGKKADKKSTHSHETNTHNEDCRGVAFSHEGNETPKRCSVTTALCCPSTKRRLGSGKDLRTETEMPERRSSVSSI